MEQYFSTIENQWVSPHRLILTFNRCMSSAGDGIFREVRYDTGQIRYVSVNGDPSTATAATSGNLVRGVSASGWVYCNCPF